MKVTDEMIAAYVDGNIEDGDKLRIEAAIAADPNLARQAEIHRALKMRLTAHFAPILDQPVPRDLTKMLSPQADRGSDGSNDVISFAKERQKRGLLPSVRRWLPIAAPALAASLVFAFWQPWQIMGAADSYADGALDAALETQLVATQPLDAETRILLSFESEAGSICRAYQGEDTGGIACRDAKGWKIERSMGTGDRQSTDFRQAGSQSALFGMAQEMAKDSAYDADAEASAKKNGWR